MGKVMLVFPQHGFFGWKSLGVHAESLYQNHGLNQISRILKDRGHTVALADTRSMGGWADFARQVLDFRPDVAGIFSTSVLYRTALEVAQHCKALGVPRVAIGGPHPSIPHMAPGIAAEDCFDAVFMGEGEISFPRWVDGAPTPADKLIRGERPNLDTLQYEDRDLFDQAKTIYCDRHTFYSPPWVSVIAGRGCPFHCAFCDGPGERHTFGEFRRRSVEHLVGEMAELAKRFDYHLCQVDDDAFVLPPWEYVWDFVEQYAPIKAQKPDGRYLIAQARADTIVQHQDLMEGLARVGLRFVQVGFEAGSQRMLDMLRKGTTVETNIKAAEVAHRLGLKIWANFMLGMPTETKEEQRATIEMVKRMRPEHPSPAFFAPTPGSPMYQYCLDNDLLLDPLVNRSPTGPKIKGVDYSYLRQLLGEIGC